jgi:hypothetical protein
MKKAFIAIIIFLFAITFTQAQVTFKPGIKAGVNLSHFTKDDDFFNVDDWDDEDNDGIEMTFQSKTDFYVGVFGEIKLTKLYSLQPEITYTRQGSKYNIEDTNTSENIGSGQIDVSYVSMELMSKFSFNKFNVHVGPSINLLVENNDDIDPDSDLDLAFILGAGYQFTDHLGIEIRAKRGIIPVIDTSDSDHSNVVFSFGATYTFDVK